MENNDNSELDRILDSALQSYSGAEPLTGLAQRVSNRIRIAETRRIRFRFLQFAMAAVAGFLIGAIVLRTDRTPAPAITAAVHPPKPPVEAAVAPAPRIAIRRAAGIRSLPKESQFPLRVPLTAEERALLALAEYSPVDARKPSADGPIEIQAIEIPPLQSDGSQ